MWLGNSCAHQRDQCWGLTQRYIDPRSQPRKSACPLFTRKTENMSEMYQKEDVGSNVQETVTRELAGGHPDPLAATDPLDKESKRG